MGKKILVISNACFSSSDSNGRTLEKYFEKIHPEQLAQFFVYGMPDLRICSNYYCVSDHDALYTFLHRTDINGIITKKKVMPQNIISLKKRKKSPFKMLLREYIWKHGKWNGTYLKKWINDFNPDIIFLSLADNAFLIDFARKIAQYYNIPIIAFSTENYYFKNYNYITKRASIFYWLFHRKLKIAYKCCANYIQTGIFNTPMLTEKYNQEFKYDCHCVFPKSDIHYIKNELLPGNDNIVVSYLGNLGLNRHKALLEVADCLSQIIPDVKLQVYGRLPNDIEKEVLESPNIQYNGFVPYEKVISIMHKSTLLLHIEYNDSFNNMDLKYAFSAKIADSICCGTPLLIYADQNLAETSFLKENRCAFIASDREQLRTLLKISLTDVVQREIVIKNAKIVREKYFTNAKEISDYFE